MKLAGRSRIPQQNPTFWRKMQRHNTIVALGGMFLLLQVLSFIAHVRGSGRKADDVLQLEDNPCRPINFNGRMIPTVPEYMPSFPGSVKGIKRHFVCRPVEPTTTPAMTTQNPTSSSSTTKKTTTSSSSTTKEPEATTISTMGSTTTDPPTTTTFTTTTKAEEATISTMGSATTKSDPSTTITSFTTKEPEASTFSTMGSTTTDPPTTITSSTNKESTTISTTDSTTSESTTITVSPTTQDSTTMSTTMESTTSNPTTVGEPTVKIFVTDELTDNKIFVADLQDELSFTSIPSTTEPRFITYDSVDEKIYWTDEGEKRVYRADVDGGNRETVTQGSDDRRGIAIAETSRTLYIANKSPTKITSLSIGEGSTIPGDEAEFVSPDSEPISLEVDEEQKYLYWTDTLGKIRRKPLDGSGVTKDLYTDSNLSELYGLSIGPSSGGFRYVFFCDFSEEKTFYLEVSDDESYDYELDGLTDSGYSTPGTKLRDITYFDGVLFWTKEENPSAITVMRNYQHASSRSYEIIETSGIEKPYQLLITTVYP